MMCAVRHQPRQGQAASTLILPPEERSKPLQVGFRHVVETSSESNRFNPDDRSIGSRVSLDGCIERGRDLSSRPLVLKPSLRWCRAFLSFVIRSGSYSGFRMGHHGSRGLLGSSP